MSDIDPGLKLLRRPPSMRQTLALAAVTLIAAGCGNKPSQPSAVNTSTGPKIERAHSDPRVNNETVQLSAQGLARRIQKLSKTKQSRIDTFNFPIGCDSRGNCSQLSAQDLRKEATINAHILKFDLPRDPSKRFVGMLTGKGNYSNDQSFSLAVKHANKDGTRRDLKTLESVSINTNSQQPLTFYRLDLNQDKKLGGWSLDAEYSTFSNHEYADHNVAFCFNTNIQEPTGQYLPLRTDEFSKLLATAEDVINSSESGKAIEPIAIPNNVPGREISYGYDGCSTARTITHSFIMPQTSAGPSTLR